MRRHRKRLGMFSAADWHISARRRGNGLWSVQTGKQKAGSISAVTAQPEYTAYSATKAAIVQMTRNMALDFATFNIRVNCVCPGTVLTPTLDRYASQKGMTMEQFTQLGLRRTCCIDWLNREK